jgi:hypothetical protein
MEKADPRAVLPSFDRISIDTCSSNVLSERYLCGVIWEMHVTSSDIVGMMHR